MARTLMAHSPGLSRTVIMVPTGHFGRILFSPIALKDICDVKNSRLRQDLPILINYSDFAISRGLYAKFREK